MGGNDSSIEKHQQKFMQIFNNNFELDESKLDENFGQIQLFKNKNTGITQIMVKSMSYSQTNQIQKIIQTLKQRVVNPIPNLLSIYNVYFAVRVFQLRYLFSIFQDPQNQNQTNDVNTKIITSVNSNVINQNKVVWKILISLINAIKHLHDKNVFHGQIRMENVLIDADYRMKLVEKALLNSRNWVIELTTENVKLVKGKGVLFSPCILKCLHHQRTQITAYDPFKADIFAVGMIMLECATLKQAQNFYDYEGFSVKTKEIHLAIYESRKKYSFQIMNLIQRMLEQNDQQRPDSGRVFQKIRKIPNETIKQLNMTLNESFLNESIRSYM